jgi:ribosomal protein L3
MNKQITEYQSDNSIANKSLEQWATEAKIHLVELQLMRQKINQSVEYQKEIESNLSRHDKAVKLIDTIIKDSKSNDTKS